jgi:hypothetical protein
MYFHIKNHSTSAVTKSDDISALQNAAPVGLTKSEFRAWCAEPGTSHVFYSMAEGDCPSQRVSEDNPVNKLHGFVADFDAPVDWTKVPDLLEARCVPDFKPTWYSRTQSGYIRLVWEFEKPITVAPALAEGLLRRVSDMVKAPTLFAGFDRTSLKVSQYFELGRDWTKGGGGRIPTSSVMTVLLKVANDVPLQTGDVHIPLSVVAAEVAKRFPGRWTKDFEVGTRGPLFWINDGIDRDGCQVRENGMICYSDRAGSGFVSWREIFGKQFVEKFERDKVSSVLSNYWFSGKVFYKLHDDTPVAIPKDQLILELRRAGFSPKTAKGQALSEVEQAILAISNECRVSEVAPIVYSGDRVVHFNGRRILNSNTCRPVAPSQTPDPSNWPWLQQFLVNLFAPDNAGNQTLPYFLAWFKRFYLSVLNHRLDQGQLLILLGPTGKGKTLLTNRIVGDAVGGFADASEYLSGRTSFNRDLCGAAAWVIDDQVAASTYADQRKFVELTKRCVANPRLEYHAKYADAIPLPWSGRVMMSLNLDANSLAALPTLDSSNRDKVIALRVRGDSNVKFGSNQTVEAVIKQELPHFLRWLSDLTLPKEIIDSNRFGVRTYVDSFIEAAAYDNSSRSAIAEMVEFFAKKVREHLDKPTWRGTLTEFTVALHEANGGRSVGNSTNLEFVRRGMTVMEEISRANPKLRPVRSRGGGGGKVWEIDLSDKYDIDHGEPIN